MSLVAAFGLSLALAASTPVQSHQEQVEAWRKGRVERLTSPTGWLTLVGLHWIKPGINRIGNGDGVDINLGRGPAELGTLRWEGERLYFRANGEVVTVDDQPVLGIDLVADSKGTPTVVKFGTAQFYVVERGGRLGLRVKDSTSPVRTEFAGIDYFAIGEQWRFEAKWEAHEPPRTMEIVTVLGDQEQIPNPGRAVFEVDGKQYALEALVEEGEERLFFIVFDATSGKQTYGSGRFFYADQPVAGKITIDFNQAYNPPCAFTEFSTCQLPPPENRLRLAIEAGEKKYAGPH